MSVSDWQEVGICPNPCCHRIVVRMADVIISRGCLEFMCPYGKQGCRTRAILGGPDHEFPPRPHLIIVRSAEEYARYRAAACVRAGKSPPVRPGREILRA